MKKSEIVTTRIEPTLKSNVEEVLSSLGMTPSDAINIFFNQIVLQRGLPFDVRLPQMTVEQAKEELIGLLREGEQSRKNEKCYTIAESRALLGF